jgi:nitrogen fixation protein NifB
MSATPIIESAGARDRMSSHPCYGFAHAATAARVHLPVAPRCNLQCRFCDRSFDCLNESRPGVAAEVIGPAEALRRVDYLRSRLPSLAVAGIAGPGDPLANPREVLETFRLVRASHPDLILCLATNGLALPELVEDLAEAGVSHLTVTVNAVSPEIGAGIYSWIRWGGRARSGPEAAALLWERQREGIARAAAAGMLVKINAVLLPGINEAEMAAIARETAAAGASSMNVMPLIPVAGTPLAALGEPSREAVAEVRRAASAFLPQLSHCKRCRADAAGILGQDLPLDELVPPSEQGGREDLAPAGAAAPREGCSGPADPPAAPIVAAVASREGFYVNQHLGEADKVFVFSATGAGKIVSLGVRPLPESGGGMARWREVAAAIADCEYLFASGAGAPPRAVLEAAGIKVRIVEGLASEALRAAAAGRDLAAFVPRSSCGGGCSGGASRGCGCA